MENGDGDRKFLTRSIAGTTNDMNIDGAINGKLAEYDQMEQAGQLAAIIKWYMKAAHWKEYGRSNAVERRTMAR